MGRNAQMFQAIQTIFPPGALSEVGYFHSFSLEEDPLLMKEICDQHGVRVSSISSHSPLMKPEAAVDRLTRSAVLASMVGCDFLNSDEMLKPDWMDDDFAHDTMRYSLTRAAQVCARHKKYLCIRSDESLADKVLKETDDFRTILDDVDAVHIATGDHWHVPALLLAARAGKHVYVEKPLGVSIEECLACREVVEERPDLQVQYGTQNRSPAYVRPILELGRNGHIGEVNAPPVAVDDGFLAGGGVAGAISVLANDSDPEGKPVGVMSVTQASNGTVVNNLDNVIYIPDPGFDGFDTFTYTINDGSGGQATTTVNVTVLGQSGAGLLFGSVPGNINTTDPNPQTGLTIDLSETEDGIGGNTTEVYTGEIYDADGNVSFTEDIDDRARIYIDGVLVLTSDVWNDRVSTGNLALTPGWHAIEIRISNGGGGSGPVSSPGIGYDPAGGTSWIHLEDPGDGSVLRYVTAAPLDTDGDGDPDSSDPDDGDGMPDAWEVANGLDPLLDDRSGNLDGDPYDNWFEYVTDTLAGDGSSYQIFSIDPAPGTGVPVISFSTSGARNYVVEYSDDLSPGSWQELGPVFDGTGAEMSVSDSSGAVRRFYRLRIEMP